jgi:hypothetical protein
MPKMFLVQLCLITNCKHGEGELEVVILDVTKKIQMAEFEIAIHNIM